MAEQSWYDPAKLAAALRGQTVGNDGRNLLSSQNSLGILNNLSGLQKSQELVFNPEATGTWDPVNHEWVGGNGTSGWEQQGGFVLGGQHFAPNGDGTFHTRYDDPSASSNHDRIEADYKIDADGNAVPVGGAKGYNPGNWVGAPRDFAKYAGLAIAGGAAASALGAGGAAVGEGAAAAGEGAAAAGEGAAAAAAAEGAAPALGAAESGGGALTTGLGGASTGPGFGGIAEVGGGFVGGGMTATEGLAQGIGGVANGSGGLGAGLGGFGMGELGGAAAAGGGSLLDQLGQKIADKADNPQTYLDALKAYGGGNSQGGSGGGNSMGPFSFLPDRKAAIQAEALRAQKQGQQQGYMPTTIKV